MFYILKRTNLEVIKINTRTYSVVKPIFSIPANAMCTGKWLFIDVSAIAKSYCCLIKQMPTKTIEKLLQG